MGLSGPSHLGLSGWPGAWQRRSGMLFTQTRARGETGTEALIQQGRLKESGGGTLEEVRCGIRSRSQCTHPVVLGGSHRAPRSLYIKLCPQQSCCWAVPGSCAHNNCDAPHPCPSQEVISSAARTVRLSLGVHRGWTPQLLGRKTSPTNANSAGLPSATRATWPATARCTQVRRNASWVTFRSLEGTKSLSALPSFRAFRGKALPLLHLRSSL